MRASTLILALTAVLGVSGVAQAWTGPQVTLVNKNGRQVIQICDQGGACTTSTPFFLAINSQATAIANHDWSTFLYEAQLQLNYVNPTQNGIVPILQVHLLNESTAFLNELAGKLNQLSPRPYLYVRYYLDAPATGGFEHMTIANLAGVTHDDNGEQGQPFSMSEPWLEFQESQVSSVLNTLDSAYPGRVVGLNIAYANGGEWFMRPTGYLPAQSTLVDWGADTLCATGTDSVQKCNLFPWSNDSGTQPGPIGRQSFFLDDYSPTSQAGFCAWSALPASLRTSCRAATVVERNNAVPGLAPPALGLARGVFLDPADTGSLRGAYYNRFLAQQYVNAIIRLLTRAKQVSSSHILTSTFYGYFNGLSAELATSGHTALAALQASPMIDIVAGPYSYAFSRTLDAPYASQGLTDSPRLASKLWFDEDDTRTELADPSAGFRNVTNLWDTIRILRRDIITAGLHNHGIWLLDLVDGGWFGRPDQNSDSNSLWANLTNAFTAVNKLQLSAPNRYNPQIAVFTDDLSPAYVAGLTPAGDNTFGFTNDVGITQLNVLQQLGTPIKQYLLSDLLNGNLDLSAIKLAVFQNTWNVPASIRSAIDAKLRTPGRTLLFIYAAGYLNGDNPASVANISALTGITVAVGAGAPVLSENFNVNGQNVAGGPAYPLTPWFQITDGAATSLGTYAVAGGVSMARKSIAVAGGSYTSVVAAAPNLPLAMLRKLSEDAGVFHFAAPGDFVEAAGNMVMVHAATTGFKTLNFPQTMPRIFETGLFPSDTEMCTSCAQLASLPFNDGDTRVFRWTSAPIGNFELISGTTLEGWAADLDDPDQSIAVDVYIGGPFGVGTFFTEIGATSSRPDVAAAFGIAPNKGFAFNVGTCPSGQTLFAYALDPESGGDGNTLIGAHTCPTSRP